MTNPVSFTRIIPIYHIVDYRNLQQIIDLNGLFCKSDLVNRGIINIDIAQPGIQERRFKYKVPVCKEGYLSDYVPFYFANRSPMLYSIHTGNVESYNGSQNDIVYLVSSVQKIYQSQLECCYTDGHAIIRFTEFFDELSELEDSIDWDIISSWSWHDTDEDENRKRKKQAEFLVHRYVPWDLVETIAVIDPIMKQKVESIIAMSGSLHNPGVEIRRNWYYDN